MTDLTQLDVVELGALIAAKHVSPVEVTDAFLARIEQVNTGLNAFVTLTPEAARATARAAEAEIQSGTHRGPLHGIPLGHKDLYATAGVRTTGGSRVLADNVPTEDSTVAARLAASGTVMLGKLNTHEFAYGPTNENSMFGPTRNPWNTDRITGGSSGGSGAAVAAGLAPIASGSDTGGSIRMPAACCGLTGLKPTYGRVSRAGILPLCWSMDHAGPLARSAMDAAIFLGAVAGHDPRDAASADRPVPDYPAALTGALASERGRWLLDGGHADADCELSVSGLINGRLSNVIIDRTFRDRDGQRWIVDYKTSLPGDGQSLDDFLAAESERYALQLGLYGTALEAIKAAPVRCALYFVALGRHHEIPWKNPSSCAP